MQDATISNWGAQDRFQAHFIVRKDVSMPSNFVARTVLKTTGHFGAKKVASVRWVGGMLADVLNTDADLGQLIAKQTVLDATIFVDPSDTGVRIYSKWKNSHDFKITKDLYAIFNKIAGHIKNL